VSHPSLILASGSPRRARALEQLGLGFTVDPPDVDESQLPAEQPEDMVLRLALDKVGLATFDTVRLAVDTIVVLDGDILGKPEDPDDAVRGLLRLGGRRHTVISGWSVAAAGGVNSGTVTTEVQMRSIDRSEAVAYVATGEPMDKAGSYAIQGFGSRFIAGIDGSLGNVLGFPVEAIAPALRGVGVDVPRDAVPLVAMRAR
jgi:septum formation protein